MSSKELIAIYTLVASSFIPMYRPDGIRPNILIPNIDTKEIPALTIENNAIIPEEAESKEPKRILIKSPSQSKTHPNP